MTANRSGLSGRLLILALCLLCLVAAGCGRSTVWYGEVPDGGGPKNPEICTNGVDDDGDFFIDCQDSDCKTHPSCSSKPQEECTNGKDDDLDNLTDCNDPDCFNHPACKVLPENCTNGVDDDGDGLIDCADPWCFKHPDCQAKKEVCNNGKDDDGDGLVDCNDPDCRNDPGCKKNENCTNGVDDDGDGFTDCQDSDCKNHPACGTTPENCTNGQDDDGDGLTDCNDPDCFSHPSCKASPEICDNGKDDDGDGLVDCKDPQCFNHPSCQAKKEICDNKVDDDGDGLTDCSDPDCYTHPSCTTKKEICNNKVDDDGDGKVDCDDPDCKGDPICTGPGKELCTNGIDDDGDTLVDCDDPDCKSDPSCQVKKEICNNKQDDDGDKLVDCNDPDCFKHPDCKTPGKEVCNNGVDDDQDGLIDCKDPDCSWLPMCSPGKENCTNKKDDDNDGAVDCDDPDCKNDPACQQILCKPSVSFGTLQPKGSSVTRTVDTSKIKTDVYATPCVIPGGGEVVAIFTLTGTTDLMLTYEQLSGDSVYGLFAAGVKEACNANPKGCYDPKSATKGSFSIKNLAAGSYYLITEAFAKGLEGQSKITLSTGTAASKEICNDGKDNDLDGAIDCADLDCYFHTACANQQCKPDVNLGTLVVNGPAKTTTVNTLTANNTYDLVCAAGGGGDRTVRFAMPSAAVLGVTVSQQGYHAFGLFHDKGPGTKCNADSKGSCLQKTWPGIIIDYGTKEKGVYYYIVDEMSKGKGGNVQLSFRAYKNRGPELCTNGIDDDGDGLIDCLDPDCTGVVGCPGPVCTPDKKTGPMAIGSQVSFSVNTKNSNNDMTVPCALGGGKDEVIEIVLTQTTALRVNCNQTGDHVLGLFAKGKPRDPCDKTKLSCADPKTGPIGCNFYWGNMQPGTYYLVVEAFKPGTEGTMNITLRATKDSVQEICNNGKDDDGDGKIDCQDYNCATSPYCKGKTCTPDQKLGLLQIGKKNSVAMTTSGAGDSNTTSCSTGGGEDYVVGFTLPKTSTVTVDWAQFGDHVIALHSDKGTGFSCDAAPLKCVATSAKSVGQTTFANLSAGQYFIVVDAAAKGKEGSAVLQITAK